MADRAYDQEVKQWTDAPSPPGGTRPSADPTGAGATHRLGLGRDARILYGRVVDYVAYVHFYRVQLERGGAIIGCVDTSQTSLLVFGARAINSYAAGTGVLVVYHPQTLYGFILCAIPDFLWDARHALSDLIVQGGNTGLRTDGVHLAPMSLHKNGGVGDFSAGRPFDSIHSGEWGAMTETGLAFFLDPFLAYMRVDEETGLFLFYHDQYARLAGHNLDVRSAGSSDYRLDDENEWSLIGGWTPYLWEAKGTFGPGTGAAVSRTLTPEETQQSSPWYGAVEPALDDQLSFWRSLSFQGHLGQGGKRMQVVPPVGATDGTFFALGSPTVVPGVAEEQWGLDGGIGLRSAKSVIISKRPIIPGPKQLCTPEDPAGDNRTNYKAAGVYGEGATQYVGDIPDPGGANPHVVKAAAFVDQYAHVFNWKGAHAFTYHALDWYIPEESDAPNASNMADGIPDYGSLASTQYLPQPTAFLWRVDARYGNVAYFPNHSYIALLDDGGIVIADGYGAEIRMTGGSIFQAAPGDIWRLPGRSDVVWAGWDAIVRANNCVDLSANWADVRIKAENNVMIVAGNNQCGGVLIESRASAVAYKNQSPTPVLSGVVVRCPNSPVAILAGDVLISTVALGGSGLPAHIVLDAGPAKIIANCDSFERRLASSAVDVFADGAVNEFWATEANFGSSVSVMGQVAATSCIVAGGSMICGGATAFASTGAYDSPTAAAVAADMAQIVVRQAAAVAYAASAAADLTELAGRTDVLLVEFAFRDTGDYLTSDLAVLEPRWHQQARESGQSLAKWQENILGASYPHPGKAAWVTGSSYGQQALTLFDDTANLAVDREGGAYEHPTYGATTYVALDGNWPVAVNPL